MAPIKAWGLMPKVVLQVVLLYGSEIWLVIDAKMTLLDGFHHRIEK